jgi:hypothetical protein
MRERYRAFLTYFLQKSEFYKIIVLSVCPTPITLNELVHFQEIQYAGHVIGCDLNAILFNPVLSTIPKYRTLKFESHIKNLNHSTCDDDIL